MRLGAINAVSGWLLVLPSAALLALFTHFPVLATIIDSFDATSRAGKPGPFVGL